MSDASRASIASVIDAHTRDVADFPSPGIAFKDLMPLLASGEAFAAVTEALAAIGRDAGADVVVGIEARGFLFGAPVAHLLGLGFVPLRKPGKLPPPVSREGYALEYGTDALEVRAGSFDARARVLLVDDVLATGGTIAAAIRLIRGCEAVPVAVAVVLELAFLGARDRHADSVALHALRVI